MSFDPFVCNFTCESCLVAFGGHGLTSPIGRPPIGSAASPPPECGQAIARVVAVCFPAGHSATPGRGATEARRRAGIETVAVDTGDPGWWLVMVPYLRPRHLRHANRYRAVRPGPSPTRTWRTSRGARPSASEPISQRGGPGRQREPTEHPAVIGRARSDGHRPASQLCAGRTQQQPTAPRGASINVFADRSNHHGLILLFGEQFYGPVTPPLAILALGREAQPPIEVRKRQREVEARQRQHALGVRAGDPYATRFTVKQRSRHGGLFQQHVYPDSAEIRINLLPSGLDAILLPA